MDTNHRWSIAAIGGATDHRNGTAATLTGSWTAALSAGRTALLAGDLDTLAVRIDGELEALYDPGRDQTELDPAAVTRAMVEIHQSVTAHVFADQLIGE